MNRYSKYLWPIIVGFMVFVALRVVSSSKPAMETARLECLFGVASGTAGAQIPFSKNIISKVEFVAELTGKSVHEDVVLWHAKGLAKFNGGSQELSGAVFVTTARKVRGISLYRDRYPEEVVDLRISTLDKNGQLDWNENSAFVYFENAPDKLAHPYDYRCNFVGNESN